MYIGGTDEKALHHLFAEVIDNSMDEALAGHATFIEVELTGDGYLTVSDNGRGIDAAGVSRIFDVGWGAKSARVSAGFGLAACHQIIVGDHRGEISVRSQVGSGTTFRIELPRDARDFVQR